MGMFGLSGFAALHVEATDTCGVVGWRRGAVVCAFRGTSTMSNVLSDVKTWMTRWEVQGGAGGAGGVRVHAGGVLHAGLECMHARMRRPPEGHLLCACVDAGRMLAMLAD